MKRYLFSLGAAVLGGLVLMGCGKTESPPPPPTGSAGQPPPPAGSAAAVKEAAVAVKDAAVAAATDVSSQLMATVKSKGDQVLTGITTDLGTKVKELAQSLSGNETVKGYLDSAVKSLTGGKDIDAMGAVGKLTEAKLTPDQTKLLGDVKNLVSAYVTQNNFAGVKGAESDVAQVVSHLRQGEVTAVVPYLQKVAQNATLTPAQKDLVGSLLDTYAPGLKAAGQKVQDGLKSLNLKP